MSAGFDNDSAMNPTSQTTSQQGGMGMGMGTGMAGNTAGTTGTAGTTQTGTGTGGGGGDALDKGVDMLERKAGHEQSHSTTEKISDGLRTGFMKMTGKDVPIKDQTYQ